MGSPPSLSASSTSPMKACHAESYTESTNKDACLLSSFLFLLAIDCVMKTTTAQRRNGIQWTMWKQLDDLDFADDLALLSHKQQHMQEKTSGLETISARVGLRIHTGETKLLGINTANDGQFMLGGSGLEEVETFTYMGSIVNTHVGIDADDKDLQLQRKVSPTVWVRNIEDNHENHKKGPNLHR